MTTSGITYHKLQSEYVGDETKNCSLTSVELDQNFYFLRGYGIKDIIWDNEERTVTLVRVNGETLSCVIPECENVYSAVTATTECNCDIDLTEIEEKIAKLICDVDKLDDSVSGWADELENETNERNQAVTLLAERIVAIAREVKQYKLDADDNLSFTANHINEKIDTVKEEIREEFNEMIMDAASGTDIKTQTVISAAASSAQTLNKKIEDVQRNLNSSIVAANTLAGKSATTLDAQIKQVNSAAGASANTLNTKVDNVKNAAGASANTLNIEIGKSNTEINNLRNAAGNSATTLNQAIIDSEGRAATSANTLNQAILDVEGRAAASAGTLNQAIADAEGRAATSADTLNEMIEGVESRAAESAGTLSTEFTNKTNELNNKIDSTKNELESKINATEGKGNNNKVAGLELVGSTLKLSFQDASIPSISVDLSKFDNEVLPQDIVNVVNDYLQRISAVTEYCAQLETENEALKARIETLENTPEIAKFYIGSVWAPESTILLNRYLADVENGKIYGQVDEGYYIKIAVPSNFEIDAVNLVEGDELDLGHFTSSQATKDGKAYTVYTYRVDGTDETLVEVILK